MDGMGGESVLKKCWTGFMGAGMRALAARPAPAPVTRVEVSGVLIARAARRVVASLVLATVSLGCDQPGVKDDIPSVRIMTFNIWVGGEAGGQPLEQTVEVIRAAGADIVGIQESLAGGPDRRDNGERLAEMLGWHYLNQRGSTSVLSRFPIVGATPEGWGAVLELEPGRRAFLFNAHLPAAPYQPYQLLGMDYFGGRFIHTEEEAIREAQEARGSPLDELLAEARVALLSGLPVFITGDLNEPSHQDWTEEAALAGLAPLKVAFPTTLAITEAGWRDAFRVAYPDPVRRPGFTWTPIKAHDDPTERHDRIDFVFFGGSAVELAGAEVVGESPERGADVVVLPYPSDHRAVVATFVLR
jgi:exodeoxyribonuclease III